MNKKIFSLLMAVVLSLTLLPAFAATEAVTYVSDFENNAAVTEGETAYSYADDVWDLSNSNAQRVTGYNAKLTYDRIKLELIPEAEGSANHVLEATQLESTALTTRQVALDETVDNVYISFRFKIPAGAGSGQWQIGAGGHYTSTSSNNVDTSLLVIRDDNKIYEVDQSLHPHIAASAVNPVSYARNTWYTALIHVSQNTRAAYIYENGKLLAKKIVEDTTKNMVVARADLRYWVSGDSPAGLQIQLDDAKIMTVYKATDSVSLIESSVENGTEDVSRTPVIDLTFSRPMALPAPEDFAVNGGASISQAELIAPDTIRVSFDGVLDYSTEYTLDYSGARDLAGNAPDGDGTLSFTTEYMPLSIYPLEVSLQETGSTVSGLPLTIPLKNHTGSALSSNLMFAFYKKGAHGYGLVGLENKQVMIPADAEEISVTLSGKYHDVDHIKLLAINNKNELQPLSAFVVIQIEEDVPYYHVDRYERAPIFKQDFEGGSLPENVSASYYYSDERLDTDGGVGGSTAYKVSGDADRVSGSSTLTYTITGLSIPAGTGLTMTAKMRAEELSGTVAESGGNAYAEGLRTTMTIKNTQTGDSKSIYKIDETINGTTDWIESMQYTICNFPVNQVSVTCYVESTVTQGMGWYDDICLYTVGFDPFAEAVLESPVYKGFIYGENGEGDINLATSVLDYNIYDLENSVVTAKIVDEQDNSVATAVLTDIQEEIRISFSSKELSMGEDYYLQLSLDNKATGQCYSKREWKIRKRPEAYRPDNYFDEHGRFIVDGEPTFLMGVYGMNDLYTTIDDMAGTPINVMFPYGYVWIPIGTDNAGNPTAGVDKTLLDYAEANGVKLFPSMRNYLYSTVVSTGTFNNIINKPDDSKIILETFAEVLNHPAILGYYMADELSSERYGAEVEWGSNILSNLDPDGFTVNIFSREADARSQIRFADTSNTSAYPINAGDGTDDLSKVTTYLSGVMQHEPEGNRPVIGVLQSYKKSRALRGPDKAEMRNMAYQAICAGVQGILWYNYFEMDEEAWQTLVNVCREIEAYYPVILSTEAAPAYETDAGDWLTTIAKRYNGKSYLFTTNTSRETQTARIRVENATCVKGLYSGAIYTPDDDGWITVDYSSIGVEVFEITQPAYPSPGAQLSFMSFYNDGTGYFVSENEDAYTLYIPAGVTTIEYSAKISRNATLYINGTQVSACGALNLEGIGELTVRVVAQDTRFSEERTYRITIG